MKLESIGIRNFRSINHVSLQEFGGFNVLIGKNNSGKSNILSAIDTFFTCVQNGKVASLNPPFGDEIDFFNKDTKSNIEIDVVFNLSLSESETLIQDIITEAPQMKNATEGIGPSIKLLATISITPSPKKFSYISYLAIQKSSCSDGLPQQEQIVLKIGKEAAGELYSQLSRAQELVQDIEILTKAIERDFRHRISPLRSEAISRRTIRNLLSDGTPELSSEMESRLLGEDTSLDEVTRIAQSLIASKTEESEAIDSEHLQNAVRTFTGDESAIPQYARNVLSKIAQLKVLYLRDRREPIGNEEANRILRLKTQRGGTARLHNIQELVNTLLGVKIDAFQSENEISFLQRKDVSTAELDVNNFLVAVNGSGIKEALRVILDVEFEQPQLLLVEEPEIHLHPALETSMMRYLKKLNPDCQVFLTTHSTNFLDTAEMKNVYLISKPDSTQVQHIDIEEAEAQIPKELGLRLSSLFMFDHLVFVEGESDEGILREWASKLKVNFSHRNVGFVTMGGVHNFTHYAQDRTLSLLTKRQVKMLFLIDRDEKEDSEISRLTEKLGDKAKLVVLKRREIENYLICPRAITEYIRLKKEAGGDTVLNNVPKESDIAAAIQKCADELKQFAIDKRVGKIVCKPFYPSRKKLFEEGSKTSIVLKVHDEVLKLMDELESIKSKVEQTEKEQTKLVDSEWDSNKSFVVPGDILIEKVCKMYGVKFKKEQDGAILAALLEESEIDVEIKDVIQKIVT